MQYRGYDLTYPRLLLAALVVVVLTASIVGLSTSSAALGSYNSAWDGTSDMRTLVADTGATTEIGQSTSVYTSVTPNETTAFILSPSSPYTASEAARIERFLDRGGTLVVAADFDQQTNDLLAQLDVGARVDGQLVRDERQYYRGPDLPVATNVAESRFTTNVSRLTLNHATVVQPGANSTVLVNTSGFAYLDVNRNHSLDDAETLRERPVVVQESIGDGRVLLVSDPSIFINSMLAAPDNQQFVRNLATGAETVVFDYSHRSGIPWAVAGVLTIADTPLLQFLVIALFTGLCGFVWKTDRRPLSNVIAWWGSTKTQPSSDGLSESDVVARVTARHPEWDAERVERVAKGIMSEAPSTRDDD